MRKWNAAVLSLVLAMSLTAYGTEAEEETASETSSEDVQEKEEENTYSFVITVEVGAEVISKVNGLSDGLCSWTQGGQDADSLQGDDYAFAPAVYVNNGAFDAEKSLTDEEVSSDLLEDTSIVIRQESVNGVIVNDSDYTIENSDIEVCADSADGSSTCDFSGLGSALAVFGNSDVIVRNSILKASGVADMGLFVDNGAKVLLDHVEMFSSGGTLYSGYVNSPKQETMAAPPWILGIMGNSRSSNLMGTNSTLTVIDSETGASNWAVLSTDSGSDMVLNVVNSSLTLTGSDAALQADGKFDEENPYTSRSGYGTYVIGDAEETFLGVTMNLGTYAAIFTGGSAYYGNLAEGESYDLPAADGSIHYTYTADEDVQTVINSDTFGFMAHQGTNSCVLDGVLVNSEFTDFLVKSGNDITITVKNGTKLNAGNGILLQLMDNDDSTTEFNSDTQSFGETHEEYAGFPTEAVADSTTDANHMQPSDLPENGGESAQDPGNMGGKGQDGQSAPEMPSGEMGGNGQDGQSAPEMPSGEMGGKGQDGQSAPEMPSGEMGGKGQDGQMPSGTSSEGMDGGESAGGAQIGSSSCNTTVYNIIDTDLEGMIYNGIGWNANAYSDGNVKQMQLQVNLSGTATLKGAIAMTSCIHSTYEGQCYLKENGITAFDDEADAEAFAEKYQAVSFSQAEYFNIGQVANLVRSNGLNKIAVTLSDSAVWTVTDTSLVDSVAISGNASVVVEEGAVLTVNGKDYTEGTYTADDFAR